MSDFRTHEVGIHLDLLASLEFGQVWATYCVQCSAKVQDWVPVSRCISPRYADVPTQVVTVEVLDG